MIQRECRTCPFCPLAETLSWQTYLAIESQLPAYIDGVASHAGSATTNSYLRS